MRESLKQRLMTVAIEWKKESTCMRNQVGGVLVQDGRIIASGYNGSPSGLSHCFGLETCPENINGRITCTKTLHCEAAIITFCAKQGIPTNQSDLFITLFPCKECAKMLINAGIKKIYYLEEYSGINGRTLLEEAQIEIEKLDYNPDILR